MKAIIPLYNGILHKVRFFYKKLHLGAYENKTGRKLALSIKKTLSLSLYKHINGIPTKKSIFKTFKPACSYKTLAVNMNRFALYALLILTRILKWNQKRASLIKHTGSTDIPVCLNKNAKSHKTMANLAS